MKTITHAKQLSTAGRNIEFPFELMLSSELTLHCERAFRILPEKRLTTFAYLNSKPVVAKIFFSSIGHHYQGKRDSRGIKYLLNANINAPLLVYEGYARVSGIYVVIMDYLPDTINFHDLWKNENAIDRNQTLGKIMLMLAAMHEAGILHHDLHLDNFLVNQQVVYAIDGEKITRQSKMIGAKSSLQNAAWFLIHLQADKTVWISAFKTYCQGRNWNITEEQLQQFEKVVKKARSIHHEKLICKIFRDCTAIIAKKSFFSVNYFRRDMDNRTFRELIDKPDQFIEAAATQWLKKGNTASVCHVICDNKHYVIKRYNIKNKVHAIKRAFQRSRAAASWRNAHYFELLDVNTPKPLAMIESRVGSIRRRAFFITEFIAGETLVDYFTQELLPLQWRQIAINIVAMLQKLYEAGLSHGDLKATNFIVHNDKVFILDLDAVRYHKMKFMLVRAWKKDCQRFLRNWENNPEVQQYFKQLFVARGFII